jgi:hypothetical protein
MGSDLEKWLISQAPLGRTGQVGDLAPIAVFLASDDSQWLTGEQLLAHRRCPPRQFPGDDHSSLKARGFRRIVVFVNPGLLSKTFSRVDHRRPTFLEGSTDKLPFLRSDDHLCPSG